MTPYTFTVLLTFACFLVALFRARWVALALAPPCILIIARVAGLVDISSASHPLRLVVPLLGLSLAMWAAWRGKKALDRAYDQERTEEALFYALRNRGTFIGTDDDIARNARVIAGIVPKQRTFFAAIVVFASDCTDIPALFLWQLPGEWVLVYVQMLACFIVLAVLLLPERWLPWKVS